MTEFEYDPNIDDIKEEDDEFDELSENSENVITLIEDLETNDNETNDNENYDDETNANETNDENSEELIDESIDIKKNKEENRITNLKTKIAEAIKNIDKTCIKPKNVEKYKSYYDDNYYKNLVFNGTIEDVKKIKIKLELINSHMKKQWDIWTYFRSNVSSMKKTHSVGIQMYFLVKDETSDKYLGFFSLNSDFNNIKVRDEHIGWNIATKYKNLKYLMNINQCVPLRPFGFNFTGGKLLSMIAFSQEVSAMFLEKIKTRTVNPSEYPILGITTTSLFGKSIQYDRLKCLKYLGNTEGWSSLHITDEIYKKCKTLEKLLKIEPKIKNKHNTSKICVIRRIIPQLGDKTLSISKVLKQPYHRGIYFGFLYPNSKVLLNNANLTDKEISEQTDINTLPTLDTIFNDWLNRYAIPRYTHLKSEKRLKRIVMLSSTTEDKNIMYYEKFRENKIVKLGKQSIISEKGEDYEPTDEEIKKLGEQELKKEQNTKRKQNPSYQQKKKMTDKFDLEKMITLNFTGKHERLNNYIPKIIELINNEPTISKTKIHETIGCSEGDIRLIFNECVLNKA